MIDLNQIDSDYNEKMKALLFSNEHDKEAMKAKADELIIEALIELGLNRLALCFDRVIGKTLNN